MKNRVAESSRPATFVPPGMPELDQSGNPVSFFEFWPVWLVYLPVALQWSLLSLRYRSLTLPLIANPAIPLSGMVGVAKSAVLRQAGSEASGWILPWIEYQVEDAPIPEQVSRINELLPDAGLALPLVGKPSIGCRGAGVRLLQSEQELHAYLSRFPVSATIQFQQLAPWEAEAGVFYVRHPGRRQGEITSLTLKYMPYVVGDGRSTLGELVARDPRAGRLISVYRPRHEAHWQTVIEQGRPYRLVFSASHCRGAIFRDGREYITEQLSKTLDRIFDDIPGFHYGRLDIKFQDLESLREGRNFVIIEINGASSESIHIWDRNARFGAAVATLLGQYRTLFRLGQANRRLGHRPPGLRALWDAWRHESRLVKQYPAND
ncbi:MAG: D-alanine--D-alanine ligase [Gammaproteobacteria bacterium]|nr:hypothetical protein [Pseudomonadales bacterium]MCP5346714.1 D-alanine--D-alanine ligase [Pseudomonadales bacterium]